jgi:uncharacterized protein YjiS (DUF1127 family)
MSISTLFQDRIRSEPESVTRGPKTHTVLSGKSAEVTLLAGRFKRKDKARTSYLDTGHLNDHVLKDIGLERSDLTKPG